MLRGSSCVSPGVSFLFHATFVFGLAALTAGEPAGELNLQQ